MRIARALVVGVVMPLLAVVHGVGCRRPPPAPAAAKAGCEGARILVVTAVDGEMEPVLARATEMAMARPSGGYTYACGNIAGRAVLFDVLGVGPQRAESSTESALRDFPAVTAVVMIGIAGGMSSRVHIGDVTIPAKWARHDVEPARFIDVDPALLAAARTSSAAALTTCKAERYCGTKAQTLFGGTGVTGARFLADPHAVEAISARLGADVVVTDMETATVADVAARHHLPFLAVRAVSDLVFTGESEDLVDTYGDLARDNAGAVGVAVIAALPPPSR